MSEAATTEEGTSTPVWRASRKRKQVERFEVEVKEKKELSVGGGSGTALGSIPVVRYYIDHMQGDHDLLKAVHKIFYGGTGKGSMRKRQLRSFNGLEDKSATSKVEHILSTGKGWRISCIRELCQFFDLDHSGDKDTLIKRAASFVAAPFESGRTELDEEGVPTTRYRGQRKRKRTSSPQRKKQKSVKKAKKKQQKKKKTKSKAKATSSKSGPSKSKVRGPRSAKVIFVQEKRSDVMAANPGKDRLELAKIMLRQWDSLDASDRAVYESKAAEEKAAHELAMEMGDF